MDTMPADAASPLTTHHSPLTPDGAALYIHWPFCRKKCPYCDFNSHVREGVDHAAWRAALLREMGYWHARAPGFCVRSIFFGGGTPSLMEPATVAALIEEADKLWGLAAGCEITLEANPTSVEAAKFVALQQAGVNRVSLGVQSLRGESLVFLGREHSADEALAAVELAAKTFARYSFDLIYALPNQSVSAWENELTEALRYARGHLSLYQLTIEENTAFHHAYHVGKSFQLPEDSLAAELYQHTQAIMEAAGLPAYETSNHAMPGQASRHNLSYWNSDCYFGIGPGAHGRVDIKHRGHNKKHRGHNKHCVPHDRSTGYHKGDTINIVSPLDRVATRALKSPERWLAAVQHRGHGVEEELPLTALEHAEEIILMGLRLRAGIALTHPQPEVAALLAKIATTPALSGLLAQGLLQREGLHLRTTPRGMLLLNTVIEKLLA